MVVLFDYDSLLYHSVYKIVSFSDIRTWFSDGVPKEKIREQIVFDAISRAENLTLSILNDIENCGIEVDRVEYFLTTCKRSIRKAISTEYKAKRKSNKWVSAVRKSIIETYPNTHRSDEWEADDLIADYAKGNEEYLICSIDKDLQQIPGYHFNYNWNYERDENGKYKLNEYNQKIKTTRKGLSHTSEVESMCFLAIQMLMGDAGDGIKGIPRVGKVKAKKILGGCKNAFGIKRRIVQAYRDYKESLDLKSLEIRVEIVEVEKLPDTMKEFKESQLSVLYEKLKPFEFDVRIELMKNYRLLKLGNI